MKTEKDLLQKYMAEAGPSSFTEQLKVQKSIEELVIVEDYKLDITGTPVMMGGVPDFWGVEFLYQLPQSQGAQYFQHLLFNNKITPHQLFSMFCAGWMKENIFEGFKPQGIDIDKKDFDFDQTHKIPLLKVLVVGVGQGDATFCFEFGKQKRRIMMTVQREATVPKIYHVDAYYFRDTLIERKSALLKDTATVPVTPLESGLSADNYVSKLMIDPSFPASIKQLLINTPNNIEKDEYKRIENLKEQLKSLRCDDETHDILTELKDAVDAKLGEFNATYRVIKSKSETFGFLFRNPALMSTIGLKPEAVKRDVTALSLTAASQEDIAKKNTLYTMVNDLLNYPLWNYIKHFSVTYMVLEPLLPLLYDKKNEDQTLYLILRTWLTEIQRKYLLKPFKMGERSQHEKEYTLSEDAKKAMSDNSYQEHFYTAHLFLERIELVRDLVNLHEIFCATPNTSRFIHFKENFNLNIVEISLDSGYRLAVTLDQFFLALRQDKMTSAYNQLMKLTKNVLDYSKLKLEPDVYFPYSFNPLDDFGTIQDVLSSKDYPQVQLSNVLSVEEKISILVSLWIIECQFHSEDTPDKFDLKKSIFLKKVDAFINQNCDKKNNQDSFFAKDHLLARIEFYIAKNLAQRIPSALERSEHAKNRLTLQQRMSLIKGIHNNMLPDTNHNEDEEAFERYVNSLHQSAISVHGREYVNTFWNMARPYFPYMDADTLFGRVAGWVMPTNADPHIKELTLYTNFLMAINNASFLDSMYFDLPGASRDPAGSHLTDRRKCLMELMTHFLILKIDHIAHVVYSTADKNSRTSTLASGLNAATQLFIRHDAMTPYDDDQVKDFLKIFDKTDAFLNTMLSEQQAQARARTRTKSVSKSTGKIYYQSDNELVRDHGEADEDLVDASTLLNQEDPAPKPAPHPSAELVRSLKDRIRAFSDFFVKQKKACSTSAMSDILNISDNWLLALNSRLNAIELLMQRPEMNDQVHSQCAELASIVQNAMRYIQSNNATFVEFPKAQLDTAPLCDAIRHHVNDEFILKPFALEIEKAAKPAPKKTFLNQVMHSKPVETSFDVMLNGQSEQLLQSKTGVETLLNALLERTDSIGMEAKKRLEEQLKRLAVHEKLLQMLALNKAKEFDEACLFVLDTVKDTDILRGFTELFQVLDTYHKRYTSYTTVMNGLNVIMNTERSASPPTQAPLSLSGALHTQGVLRAKPSSSSRSPSPT